MLGGSHWVEPMPVWARAAQSETDMHQPPPWWWMYHLLAPDPVPAR
jgi:hypothetical protein